MATRMLIDAAHPEETRVVIVKGNRLEEFDFEVGSRKPLKGNIYLAKVTRVEPSLQAAFVEFGGNRHGFLAFNEIHPDYYQIPVADREELIAAQQREVARVAEAEDAEIDEVAESRPTDGEEEKGGGRNRRRGRGRSRRRPQSDDEQEMTVEDVGGDELEEDIAPRRAAQMVRPYKIQEVIKRRQILLVQVVKEERGNKGAALTTYLSLAGRYCVLMPNTARGGGISRKITNTTDRRKLKTIVRDLEVPDGTGVIVRTAGAARTKSEIKRDYDFLLRLWDDIRDLTLRSTAPTLVYEEASLITRAIRDLYSKDIDEVQVEGDGGYRVAKDFMKRIMPSHAKKVQPYKDRIPLFHRFQVEQQLDSMYGSEVTLPSGGYVVINSTEALVAIDVNSGKATKGRSIEETAFKTNLEAAEEVARQLRLRDLAGLVVIDFIDMEDARNNRAVERRLKDCLRVDRARIQIGRISPFGLLEMSRQRLRPGVQEVNMHRCPHCHGTGTVRSIDSTALHVLRSIEEEGIRERSAEIRVHIPTAVAIYIVNNKRRVLADIEERYGFRVEIAADPELVPPDHRIERLAASSGAPSEDRPVSSRVADQAIEDDDEDTVAEDNEAEAPAEEARDTGERERRPRRRRRRGGERGAESAPAGSEQESAEADAGNTGEAAATDGDAPAAGDADGDDDSRRRRRGRRGGRRRRGRRGDDGLELVDGLPSPFVMAAAVPDPDRDGERGPVSAGDEGQDDASDSDQPAEAVEAVTESIAAEPEAPADGPVAEPVTQPEPEPAPTEAVTDMPEAAEGPTEPESAPGPVAETEPAEAAPAVSTTLAETPPEPANEEPAVVAVEAAPEPEAPAAAAEAEPEPEPVQEEEYTGPRRSGWWRRRPRTG
ncbi:MAG: Rne/Rng family ribonuclease [Pseudomonadota bacterium]|nr:Rne/Rng family ribonuclease [Pseudomonadota bacterium]